MPPEVVHVVAVSGRTKAKLVISPDEGDFRNLEVAYPTFSKSVEERTVQDPRGRSSGTDRWGYLPDGERWRYVKFNTGDRAGYEPLPAGQADLLDQVVNSACLLAPQQTRQDTPLDRLANVERFAFGPTGITGVISIGERDYRTVLATGTALTDFEKLFAGGNVQAKCYALVGIHKLDPNRFKQLSQPLAKSNDTVTMMRGCIVSHVPLAKVLDQITAGKY